MDSHQNNTEDGESERKIKEESQMFKHQTEVREKSNR